MKGLTHFISGIAAATFVKAAVTGAIEEGNLALVLAGVGGILPDTLDFKFAQFIEPKHFNVEIDPRDPDPQAIADQVVAAVEKAWKEPGEWQMHFHTAALSSNLFRQYVIRFDSKENTFNVRIGPAVTMGQTPVELGDGVEGRSASVALPHRFRYDYEDESAVDIFGGPTFGFRKSDDGQAVDVLFLPWHRRWSHSLTGGTLFGIIVALLLGPLYGLCAGIGWFTHVLEDQLGHMGSNLFFPFTRDRFTGLKLMRSGDAIPNFGFVWLAVALIFWNLNRFHPEPAIDPSFFSGFLPYIFFVYVLPFLFIIGLGRLLTGAESRKERAWLESMGVTDNEAKSEMDENFAG